MYETIKSSIEQERPVVAATIINGPDHVGEHLLVFGSDLVEGGLDLPFQSSVIADARAQLDNGHPATREYTDGEKTYEVFLDPYVTPSELYIFGGVHVGVPLCVFAKQMGFRVHVIDARERFGSADRFPLADEIATAYADEYLTNVELGSSSYVVVLSHDPKLDDPALLSALKSDARYIGAIGSRMTNEKRRMRLKAAGLTDEQLDRLHAPIGLNIGARNPEEIALSIIAEMIAAKNNMSRASLPRAKQPIEVSAGS
ncbi:MAG TPA: XdhC/CoxI family protein [Chloroflexota bacterium]|nr:XdhC/CoxI family protein [Chloroflexota bacterium]